MIVQELWMCIKNTNLSFLFTQLHNGYSRLRRQKPVATPALGLLRLSPSYEMREDFVKFKFCETSLKLFNLLYIKSKEEAGHRTNHQCLWWQLLFVLNVLSGSDSAKIARHAVPRNNERENDFQAFF